MHDLDLYGLGELLRPDERALRDEARAFVDAEVLPGIGAHFDAGTFPREVEQGMGRRGYLGPTLPEQYGCLGAGPVAYGLICQELERGDSGVRSFASVQGSLVMWPIHEFGSDEQRQRWLPGLALGTTVGCFGLTEPGFGSNPAGMETRARKDGEDWVLSGVKRWSTNGAVADVAVVWARDEEGLVQAFLVERGTPGFEVVEIREKWSFRASVSAELRLNDARVPDSNRLAGAKGLKSALACLNQARYGIAWGVLGAAEACLSEVLDHCRDREVFGRPLGAFQISQSKLADMVTEFTKAQLVAWRLGRLKEEGRETPTQVSLAKRNNVAMALEVARTCRGMLGAEGVTLAKHCGRHLCNLETVSTYEGTHEIHTLVLGEALTGIPAYRG